MQEAISDSKPQVKLMLAPSIGYRSKTHNYLTATKSQCVPSFDTLFCNKITLHGGALKASTTHQSHLCTEIDSVAENRLVAINLKIWYLKFLLRVYVWCCPLNIHCRHDTCYINVEKNTSDKWQVLEVQYSSNHSRQFWWVSYSMYMYVVIRTLHDCPSQMNENLLISNSKLTSDSELIWWR